MPLSLNDECWEVISRYLKYINSDDFKEYAVKFAFKIRETLIGGYKSGIGEIYIVKNLVENLDGLKTPDNKGFKIYTKSIFIHGSKSYVEFQYNGKMVYSELGDLIFILSVIYKDKKYFEKLTISQFKKEYRCRWNFNEKQVYLLSHFPAFRGKKGYVPKDKWFHLCNNSGCLGSFNLLFEPDGFVYMSAEMLEQFLRNIKHLKVSEVLLTYYDRYFCSWYRQLYTLTFYANHTILDFCHFAPDILYFTDNYLRGNIGEMTCSCIGNYNKSASEFIRELVKGLKKREGKKEFAEEFLRYKCVCNDKNNDETPEFDFEDGGIGIIWTIINLGE